MAGERTEVQKSHVNFTFIDVSGLPEEREVEGRGLWRVLKGTDVPNSKRNYQNVIELFKT